MGIYIPTHPVISAYAEIKGYKHVAHLMLLARHLVTRAPLCETTQEVRNALCETTQEVRNALY